MHPMLVKRLIAGVEVFRHYFEGNSETILLMSGSVVEKGPPGSNYPSEAKAMADYVIKSLGIDRKHVVLDQKAMTTVENFQCSLPLIRAKKQHQQVSVVTSDFHVDRAMIICKNIFKDFRTEGIGHKSDLSTKDLAYEKNVEKMMIERYRERYPNWDFGDET